MCEGKCTRRQKTEDRRQKLRATSFHKMTGVAMDGEKLVGCFQNIRNGLFKSRLYGNIGKLSDGRAIGGLGITPKMSFGSTTFHLWGPNVATESHFHFFSRYMSVLSISPRPTPKMKSHRVAEQCCRINVAATSHFSLFWASYFSDAPLSQKCVFIASRSRFLFF